MQLTTKQHISTWQSLLTQLTTAIEQATESLKIKRQSSWARPKDGAVFRQDLAEEVAKLEKMQALEHLLSLHITETTFSSSLYLERQILENIKKTRQLHEIKESILLQLGLTNINLNDSDVGFFRKQQLQKESDIRALEATVSSQFRIPDYLVPTLLAFDIETVSA